MEKLRILIATHAPMSMEYGASQVAINLAAALRMLGNEVTLWSPPALESSGRWFGKLNAMRSALNQFVRNQTRFDAIDAPASLLTPGACGDSTVVVRSVQPDLRYLAVEFADGLGWSPAQVARLPDVVTRLAYHGYLVLQGWRHADLIICMGQLEMDWMRRRFPAWREKLRVYVVALSEQDQARLREVRERRAPLDSRRGIRFLWLGRWARHKGTEELLRFAEQWLAARPEDRLTIAGCGNGAEAEIPRKLLSAGRLALIPAFGRDELPDLLAGNDVGLFTSKVEGWGLALNEMLESGMPVYATAAGGVKDLSEYARATLRPFPPVLADFLSERVTTNDWKDYYEIFSWDRIAARYCDAIRSASGLRVEQ